MLKTRKHVYIYLVKFSRPLLENSFVKTARVKALRCNSQHITSIGFQIWAGPTHSLESLPIFTMRRLFFSDILHSKKHPFQCKFWFVAFISMKKNERRHHLSFQFSFPFCSWFQCASDLPKF